MQKYNCIHKVSCWSLQLAIVASVWMPSGSFPVLLGSIILLAMSAYNIYKEPTTWNGTELFLSVVGLFCGNPAVQIISMLMMTADMIDAFNQ